jgi:hypothetical protein
MPCYSIFVRFGLGVMEVLPIYSCCKGVSIASVEVGYRYSQCVVEHGKATLLRERSISNDLRAEG